MTFFIVGTYPALTRWSLSCLYAASEQEIEQAHLASVAAGQVNGRKQTKHEFNMAAQVRMHHAVGPDRSQDLSTKRLQLNLPHQRRHVGRKATRVRSSRKPERTSQPVFFERFQPTSGPKHFMQRHVAGDWNFDNQATVCLRNRRLS